jgi:hypothetical protein
MNATHRSLVAVVVTGFILVSGASVVGVAESREVLGSPDIGIYSPQNELEPGQQTTMEVYVTNSGTVDKNGPARFTDRVTSARSASIVVESGDAPIEVNTGQYPLGTVSAGTRGPIPIDVTIADSAEPGTYEIPVRVRYTYTRAVDYETSASGPTDISYTDFTVDQTRTLTVEITDAPTFEVVDVQSDVQIGERGDVELALTNTGTRTAGDATVSLTSSSDEVSFGSTSESGQSYVGEWRPGETKRLTYSVALDDDATLRDYPLSATVSYNDEDGIARQSTPLTTNVDPAPEQGFELQDVDGDLRVGEEGSLSGTLRNDGPGSIRNAVVELSVNNPDIAPRTTEFAIPDLEPGETADFEFDVDVTAAAAQGAQRFQLVVDYENGQGDGRRSEALSTRVDLGPQRDAFVVDAVDARVQAGGGTQLQLRVTNNGDETLTDISAKAFVSDPLSADDDEAFVAELAPGESVPITIAVSAGGDAITKTYPVKLDFQYTEPDGDTKVSGTYAAPVEVVPSEDDGLPVGGIVAAAVAVGAVGAVWYRRR